MSKLVRFVDVLEEGVVFVNPELVRAVRPGRAGGTLIQFDQEHHVLVNAELEDAVMALNNA